MEKKLEGEADEKKTDDMCSNKKWGNLGALLPFYKTHVSGPCPWRYVIVFTVVLFINHVYAQVTWSSFVSFN